MVEAVQPQYLGKYHIHEELGRGGFGTVFRATDTTLDRVVALKILDPLLTRDPGFLERFRREAIGAARLEHPNIVPVYEVGEAEGRSFIAMKYLPGRSLDKLLAEGRLPIERTLHILAQVAAALDFAHGKGLIHRDIKPSNIMVGPDEVSGDPDHATLTDFGLAWVADQSIMTSLGQALGTPAYMAPEQLDVDRQAEIGPASDIYSFAIVAYEMLAGRPPFVGPTPAVMAAHLTKEPPPISQFNADLPPMLWEALAPGLAKEISARPKRVGTLSASLLKGRSQIEESQRIAETARLEIEKDHQHAAETRSAVEGVVCAQVSSVSDQPRKPNDGTWSRLPSRRRAVWLLLGVATTVLLALALRGIGVIPGRSTPTPVVIEKVVKETVVVTQPIEKTVKETVLVEKPVDKIVKETVVVENTVERVVRETVVVEKPTEKTVVATIPRTNPEVSYRLVNPPLSIPHNSRVTSVAFSPDGELLATGSDDQMARLWRVSDQSLIRQLRGHTAPVMNVEFSPSGEMLASAGGDPDRTVRVWRVADGTLLYSLKHAGGTEGLAFSPDGQLLATNSSDKIIRLWSASDGQAQSMLEGLTDYAPALAFSPDGKLLASGSPTIATLRLWSLSEGQSLRVMNGYFGYNSGLSFSPDGKLIACSARTGSAQLWQVATGTKLRDLVGGTGVAGVAFNPDGLTVAAIGGQWGSPKVYLFRVSDGTLLQEVTVSGGEAVRGVAFNPKGNLLAVAFHVGGVRLWEIK